MSPKIKKETAVRINHIIEDINADAVEAVEFDFIHNEYDENGNLTKEITYDDEGGINEMLTYEYDDKGRKITEKVHFDLEEIVEIHRHQFEDSDIPVSSVKEYADGSVDQVHYTYDSDNNLLKKVTIDEDGDESEREEYEWENGNMVLFSSFDEGELTQQEKREYNDKGQLMVFETLEAAFDIRTINKYEYDEKGRRSGAKRYDANGNLVGRIEVQEFHNDHNAKIFEETPEERSYTFLEYNDDDKVIHQYDVNADTNVVLSEIFRKFDDNGLLIESDVQVDRQGRGMNQHYIIKYKYEFYA